MSYGGPAWRLAEDYAKRLRVKLKAVPVGFDDKMAVLSRDEADITIAPLLVTPARAELADFVPYSTSAQCLFGLVDNAKLAHAADIDDLNRPGGSVSI